MTAPTGRGPTTGTGSGVPATPLATAERWALVALAASAGAVPSLQPILLGGLLDADRIAPFQIGQIASAEACGMALAVLAAPFLTFLGTRRRAAVIALTTMAVANGLTAAMAGALIIGLRAVAGLGSGVLLWTLVSAISRDQNPGRTFAIYVTAQSAWGALFAATVTWVLRPRFGAGAAYCALAFIALALALLLPRLLTRVVPGSANMRASPLGLRGAAGLIGNGLFLCGVMAFWPYAALILRETTGSSATLELVAPVVIGMHVLGGAAAAMLSRLPPLLVCTAGPATMIACLAVLATVPSFPTQLAALVLFAFVWMLVPPFQLPLLIAIDPTCRAAAYISASHLVGLMAGPLLSSLAITPHSVTGTLWVAAGCLALAASVPAGLIATSADPDA